MKKFLLGVFVGLALAGLLVLGMVLAAVSAGEGPPSVRDGSTLVLALSGEIPERPPVRVPIPVIEARRPFTVHQVWDLMRKAAADKRIKAVVLFPEDLGAGWAKLQEIRQALVEFRKSGKPLLAYLRSPGAREYYLATAAERIAMSREDLLDVKGLRAEVMFLKGTLDKLGVEFEIEHAGRYKDAGDMFTRSSMRPETREVLDAVLDQLFGDFVQAVAQGRSMEADRVRALVDEGPFLAVQAQARGLVDELAFEEEFFDRLKERLGQEELRKLSCRDYVRVPAGSLGLEGGSRIALVVAEGTIVRGEDGLEEEGLLASRSFGRLLGQIREDDNIKGVILRINSPGGDAIASDEILREARRLAEKKPLVVSMSDSAASGGYFIAMTGSPVIAYPHTFTGSIGVLYGKVNLRGLYDKLGVRKELLTRGRFADLDSDYKPLSAAGREKLREGVEAIYASFLQVVAEGRKRPVEKIRPLAEGRVWLGAQARENGLVDELGGLDRAIELVKEKAGIAAGEKIRLVVYPRRRSLFDYLFRGAAETAIFRELRGRLQGLDPRPLMRGGFLSLPPYLIEVR
jgi:protease-4